MVTSTFGKAAAFKPTPSTCYPPPPPPPLPYDIPCLKGPPGFQMRLRSKIRTYKGTPHQHTRHDEIIDVLTTAGSVQGQKAFFATISTPSMLICNWLLICKKSTGDTRYWEGNVYGTKINYDGTFLPFADIDTHLIYNDHSTPTTFNQIEQEDTLIGFAEPDWQALTHVSQWYTVGAPYPPNWDR